MLHQQLSGARLQAQERTVLLLSAGSVSLLLWGLLLGGHPLFVALQEPGGIQQLLTCFMMWLLRVCSGSFPR
jgi:hypothetical protein